MFADSLPVWLALLFEQILSCHQHSGRAKTALERVSLTKGCLQVGNFATIRKSLNGLHRASIRLHGQHQTRANDLAVDAHGARAANAVFASDMRSRELQLFAQEICKVYAR